jgi:hypothetical protein
MVCALAQLDGKHLEAHDGVSIDNDLDGAPRVALASLPHW